MRFLTAECARTTAAAKSASFFFLFFFFRGVFRVPFVSTGGRRWLLREEVASTRGVAKRDARKRRAEAGGLTEV